MHRLKILFIAGWYPTKENPVNGIFVKEHAKTASLYNEIIVIYSYLDPSPQPKRLFRISEEDEDGIKTIRVKYGGIFNYIKNLIKPLRKNKDEGRVAKQNKRVGFKEGILFKFLRISYRVVNDLLYYWSIFVAFQKLLKEGFKPDIIHAHVYFAGVPGVILGYIYKIPVIITEHFTGFPRHTLSRLDIFIAKFAMNKAKLILPVSDNLRKHIEFYGIRNKFRIVPNVVNTELFYPVPNTHRRATKRMLLVALLTPKKGVSYLLRALIKLKKKREDFILDIVGDGSYRSKYEQLTQDLGITDRVQFHGLKSKEEIAEFMRRCDFFVLPSAWETFGVVLIEVLSCGKPVIASRVGGIPEIITEDVGLLVPPKDINALTEAIDYMLDHYQDYSPEKISQYAKDNFSYEVVGEKIDAIYRKMTKEL